MRIVAGEWRGRPLKAPPGARPTADRVKEALFSILGDRVVDARVLDLFAGSGALGIEALSRGAAHATFVDESADAVRAIMANLPAPERAAVMRRSATAFLRDGAAQYDLVFLDPPYRLAPRLGAALGALVAPVLAAGGLVVCESDRRHPLELEGFAATDERRYGDTLLRLHERPH